jgi:hypothetical protein
MMFSFCQRVFQRCPTHAITGNNFSSIRDARPHFQGYTINNITRRYKRSDNRPSLSTKDAVDPQPPATPAPKKTREKTPPEVLASRRYWGFPWNRYTKEQKMKRWNALGPPPLSEYRLTFGKHQGQLLADVPHSYLVKYLIPRHASISSDGDCPIVFEAVTEHMKKHPGLQSQAGRMKTISIGGVAK